MMAVQISLVELVDVKANGYCCIPLSCWYLEGGHKNVTPSTEQAVNRHFSDKTRLSIRKQLQLFHKSVQEYNIY